MVKEASPQDLRYRAALQEFADASKGSRKPTAEHRKWRRGAIAGSVALSLLGMAELSSHVAPDEHGSAAKVEASPTPQATETALGCALDSMGEATKVGNAFEVPVSLRAGGKNVPLQVQAAPYSEKKGLQNARLSWEGGLVEIKVTTDDRGVTPPRVLTVPNGVWAAIYATSGEGAERSTGPCGTLYVGPDGGVNFGNPTGNGLPPTLLSE